MLFEILTCAIASGALALSITVFFGSKKDTQLKIFNDFTTTATNLFARKKEFEDADNIFHWSMLILNHLEQLAYLVNKKKLALEYAYLYKPHIDTWYEGVVEEQLSDYLKNTPEKFEELKKLHGYLKDTPEKTGVLNNLCGLLKK